MGIIVDHAVDVLRKAAQLEEQLSAANFPPRSFDAGAPSTWPPESQYPEIWRTRADLINASKAVHELSLGPADVLRSIIGPMRILPYALSVITHYSIHEHVPKNTPIAFRDLAARLNVKQEILERIMRFAFSVRLFQEKPLGYVSHTAVSEALFRTAPALRLIELDELNSALQAWPQAIKKQDSETGEPNLPINLGMNDPRPFFDILDTQPAKMDMFSLAMRSITNVFGGQDNSFFSQGFDFAALGEGPLIDVGGGNGHMSLILAEAFPKLKVIVQDLKSNEEPANKLIPAGLKDRVRFVAHDFFQPQPEGLEPKAYFLKSVLHDWPDEECVRILENLMPGVETGAKLYCVDRVTFNPGEEKIPTYHESTNLVADLMMWTLGGAKERTETQWKELAAKVDPRLRVISYKTLPGCDFGMLELGL